MNLEALIGISLGHNFALAMKKEAEVKQGKNDYEASLYQIQGLSCLSSLASCIFSKMPYLNVGITVGNTILPFAGLILCPTSAIVKNGRYEQGVQCFDALMEKQFPRLTGILPSTVSETSVKIFSFLADYSSTITTTALTISVVTLPFFGMGYMAAGIGVPMAYQALESANLVPTKISGAIEKVMPTVVNASLLLGGGPFSKVLSFAALSSCIPGVSDYVQKKAEKIFFKKKHSQGPSLEEIDTPWVEQNELSFDAINYILENHDEYLYKINPAHCSKQAYFGIDIPKDHNFKNFLTLFEKFNWKDRYQLLKPAFRDDDRFIDFLKQKFPFQEVKSYIDEFETYIEKLALEMDLSKEEFLAEFLRGQMKGFVSVLCQEKAAKGSLQDTEDCIDSCCKILPYLLSKSEDFEKGKVEIEDILLKLAIEGGDYCARGLKRASAEIVSGLVFEGIPGLDDPQKQYTLKIRQYLQQSRQKIMHAIYQKMIEIMVRLAKEGNGVFVSTHRQTTDEHAVAIAQDVHTSDLYRQYLSLGFVPMTENERAQFGLVDFGTWSMYHPVRKQMYAAYYENLNMSIKENGEIYFIEYFRKKISDLEHLTLDQQEFLIEKLAMCSEGEKTLRSFHRLFFVMQGILNVKPIYEDWIKVIPKVASISTEKFEEEISGWTVV